MINYPQFNIISNYVSKRLFFGKMNFGDIRWHIADFSLRQKRGDFIYTMCLHGEFEIFVMQADTVDEIEKLSPNPQNDICSGCLNVFAKAKNQIMNNRMLMFYDSNTENLPRMIEPPEETEEYKATDH